jgi:DNA invertase Pin-like site-specific DNA recombinase
VEIEVAEPAQRMKAMRERRRAKGLREVRLVVPDARDPAVRARVAEEVRNLNREHEAEAMRWIEAVSIFDETR